MYQDLMNRLSDYSVDRRSTVILSKIPLILSVLLVFW